MTLSETSLGARIRIIRQLNDLTQAKMAEELALSVSQYSKIEIGVRNIGPAALEVLCLKFGVSEDFVLKGEGPLPKARSKLSVVRESSATYQESISEVELSAGWADTFCCCVKEKSETIESGVAEHGLAFDVALKPAIKSFLKRQGDEKK